METSRRSIWWKGALKSAAWNLVTGLAVGLVAAVVLYGVVHTAPVVGLSGLAAGIAPLVGGAAGFNPAVLMAFNSVISSAIGLFTGGSQAVAAYDQRHLNIQNIHEIHRLNGRVRKLELDQSIDSPAPSRQVQKIIENGPRHTHNFQSAETQRAAEAKGPTIH